MRFDRRSSVLKSFSRRIVPGSSANSFVYQRLIGNEFDSEKEALAWLFQGQSPEERRVLLTDAVDALPVDTVVELLQAAASSGNQNISHFMLRMLKKHGLSAGADDGDTL